MTDSLYLRNLEFWARKVLFTFAFAYFSYFSSEGLFFLCQNPFLRGSWNWNAWIGLPGSVPLRCSVIGEPAPDSCRSTSCLGQTFLLIKKVQMARRPKLFQSEDFCAGHLFSRHRLRGFKGMDYIFNVK